MNRYGASPGGGAQTYPQGYRCPVHLVKAELECRVREAPLGIASERQYCSALFHPYVQLQGAVS
jgi:hypothetical protein